MELSAANKISAEWIIADW